MHATQPAITFCVIEGDEVTNMKMWKLKVVTPQYAMKVRKAARHTHTHTHAALPIHSLCTTRRANTTPLSHSRERNSVPILEVDG